MPTGYPAAKQEPRRRQRGREREQRRRVAGTPEEREARRQDGREYQWRRRAAGTQCFFWNLSLWRGALSLSRVVTPIGTAKTRVKQWSTGQGVFLPFVKDSFCNLLYCGHVDFDSVNWSRAFMECGQAAKWWSKFFDPSLTCSCD